MEAGASSISTGQVHVVHTLQVMTAFLCPDGFHVVHHFFQHAYGRRSIRLPQDMAVGNGDRWVYRYEECSGAQNVVLRVEQVILVAVDHVGDRVWVRACCVLSYEDVVCPPRPDVGGEGTEIGVGHDLGGPVFETGQESFHVGREAGPHATCRVDRLQRENNLVEPLNLAARVNVHRRRGGTH